MLEIEAGLLRRRVAVGPGRRPRGTHPPLSTALSAQSPPAQSPPDPPTPPPEKIYISNNAPSQRKYPPFDQTINPIKKLTPTTVNREGEKYRHNNVPSRTDLLALKSPGSRPFEGGTCTFHHYPPPAFHWCTSLILCLVGKNIGDILREVE